MKEIYTSSYSIQDMYVVHIPSFRSVNLLYCEGYFINITLIEGKAKNRSPYLLWGRYQHVIGT